MGAGARGARGIGVAVAASLVATLLTLGPADAAPPDRDSAPMSDEQRRRHGERVATPRETEPVLPSVDAAAVDAALDAMPQSAPAVVAWPEPSVVEVDVR